MWHIGIGEIKHRFYTTSLSLKYMLLKIDKEIFLSCTWKIRDRYTILEEMTIIVFVGRS